MNVLLITVDDMNADTPGCFGGSAIVTPCIDGLAAEGMRFGRAHVNVAICQPSRSVMMTGRFPHRNGAEGFGPIRDDVPVLTDLLRPAGYRCGILGKVGHLAPVERFAWDTQVDRDDLGHGRDPRRYAAEARRFIAESADLGRPWFLMCNTHDPHRPFSGSRQEAANFGDELTTIPLPSRVFDAEECRVPGFLPDLHDVVVETAEYLGSCRRADDVVGAVLRRLDLSGQADDTLVVFLSDNGMSFPFAKSNCYLHSTRTPLIVRWPGRVPPGSVDDQHYVSGVDLVPTICEAVGVDRPGGLDGASLLPLLDGRTQPGRDGVVTVFHETAYGRRYEMRAVQDRTSGYIWNVWSDGDAAYLADNMTGLSWSAMSRAAGADPELAARRRHYLHRAPEELYDFERDPDALDDRAGDPAADHELARSRAELRRWMHDMDDPLAGAYDAFLATAPVAGEIGVAVFDVEIALKAGPRPSVSPLIFGGLVEHLGRSIYGGVWDAGAEVARADVTAAIRALGVSMLRWPGGCFSSWYHWRDGVGPPGERPAHDRTYWTDMSALMGPEVATAMGPPETNRFGTDEFLRYCADTCCEPFLVANLGAGNPTGTGTPDEAAAWVRYCNVDRSSSTPVRWWAIGNETWGAHELGHCTAADYAGRFTCFAEAMRREDPSIRLVAAGVSRDQYGLGATGLWDGWNATLLSDAGPAIDALSLHWYFPGMIGRPLRDDEGDYLQVATGADDLDRILTEVGAEIDLALPGRRLPVALDEWGQMAAFEDHLGVSHRLSDAVFFAGCYNAMLRHADRVSMAMIAGLVNVLAPIQTVGDRHHVTSAYLVGYLYRQLTRAESVPVQVDGPTLHVPPMADLDAALMMSSDARISRRSPAVDVSATTDAGGTTVFVANRSIDEPAKVMVGGLGDASEAVWHTVTGPHLFARNDADHPDVLGLARRPIAVDGGHLVLEVPPATTGALSTTRGI